MTHDSTIAATQELPLAGMVTVTTGASRGIGARIAHALAAAGADVVAVGRDRAALDGVVASIGSGATAMPCDVANDDDCERLVAAVLERFGHIDVLVNNAGITSVAAVQDESPATFRRVLEVNLVAPFVLMHLVGPHMLARRCGSIINVSSIFGLVGAGRPAQASYAASKGGLTQLTRETAAEWARNGVRVNAIAPAFFHDTGMAEDVWTNEASLAWIRRKTPMGRGGELHELDGAVVFLASNASSYVTGHVLAVDGGWTAV